MAVPGVVLSPRNDSLGGPTREEAEAISESYKTKFGGANRGAPMVLSGSMNVDIVSFSPDQMKLYKGLGHSFFRKKKMDLVYKELKYFKDVHKVEYNYFWADTFLAMNKKEFDAFIEMYKEI